MQSASRLRFFAAAIPSAIVIVLIQLAHAQPFSLTPPPGSQSPTSQSHAQPFNLTSSPGQPPTSQPATGPTTNPATTRASTQADPLSDPVTAIEYLLKLTREENFEAIHDVNLESATTSELREQYMPLRRQFHAGYSIKPVDSNRIGPVVAVICEVFDRSGSRRWVFSVLAINRFDEMEGRDRRAEILQIKPRRAREHNKAQRLANQAAGRAAGGDAACEITRGRLSIVDIFPPTFRQGQFGRDVQEWVEFLRGIVV